MKRMISALLALVLCMTLCTPAFAQEDSWTIFVYVCGADLESDAALASRNMQEMIDADTTPNVRFVVQTGGAASWNNGASPDELDRFLITEGSGTIVDRQPLANMGSSETLRDFLRWGIGAYPASHYGLILWNHGGGSISGVCFDELYDSSSLALRDIGNALDGVRDLTPGGIDFIGFDACLMATVESAAMLAPYAGYMIASQETEPGSGWEYASIGRFLSENPGADVLALGKEICDTYNVNCINNDSGECVTLSVTELSKIPALRTAFDAYAQNLYEATENGADYTPIARNIVAAESFGGNNPSEGFTNMVDLGALIDAGASWSANTKAARDALDAAIVYKVSGDNHSEASGLSVYYPLMVQGSRELTTFRDVAVSSYYLALVDKVAYAYANSGSWDDYSGSTDWEMDDQIPGQSEAISFDMEPALDENGIYGFVLSEEGLNNTAGVEAVVYLVSEDGEDSICLGYTSDVLADWETGYVTDNFDGYWFSMPNGQCLSVNLIDECEGYDLFTATVRVNGNDTNLRFAWDYETGEVRILDLWDGIDENGIAARPGDPMKPGDTVVPTYAAFSNYDDEQSTYIGNEYVWQFGDELGFDMLPDGDYFYAFCIYDIYGGSYMTDFVSFTVDGGTILYDA